MNRSRPRGDLPEPVSRYLDEVAVMQPPDDLLDAAVVEIERTSHASRFSPVPYAGLAAAAAIGIALLFSGLFSSAPMNMGGDETPIPSVTPMPASSPRALGVGVDAYLLAEGEGPKGPWSYWVYTAPCGRAETTALWTSVGYRAVPYLRRGSDLERCVGGDTREQPYVVELTGVGLADGSAFVYGQTRLDVVRVTVRLADGREFDVDTIAAPDGLEWNVRFWVMLIPDDSFDLTVRGYDADGQYVGGNLDAAGPAAP